MDIPGPRRRLATHDLRSRRLALARAAGVDRPAMPPDPRSHPSQRTHSRNWPFCAAQSPASSQLANHAESAIRRRAGFRPDHAPRPAPPAPGDVVHAVGLHRHAGNRPDRIRPGHARPGLAVFSPPPPGHAGRTPTAAGHRRRSAVSAVRPRRARSPGVSDAPTDVIGPPSASSAPPHARIAPWVAAAAKPVSGCGQPALGSRSVI
jgi:hypothetical protein